MFVCVDVCFLDEGMERKRSVFTRYLVPFPFLIINFGIINFEVMEYPQNA